MNIDIKPGKDYKILAELNEGVQTLHHELYPHEFKKYDPDSIGKAFEKMIAQANAHAYIAYNDETPVGYILCFVLTRNENEFQYPKDYLLIDQIAVDPAFRRKGVASLLLTKAKELASDLSISEIHLEHWNKNKEAELFFKVKGFDYLKHKMELTI